MAYLYRHIRLDKNEPFYIGISNNSDNYYRAGHKSSRNKIWKGIVGKSEYRSEIILDNLSWEEACKKEVEFIVLYGRIIDNTGTLCNLTEGGEGNTGAIPWNKGVKGIVKASQSTKDKMSLIHKGKVLSESHKQKIGNANKNISEETRKKLSDINIGNKNFLGKSHKESSKLLQAYSKGARILDENNYVCYIGATSASIFLGVSSSNIRNQLCGLRKNTLNLKSLN